MSNPARVLAEGDVRRMLRHVSLLRATLTETALRFCSASRQAYALARSPASGGKWCSGRTTELMTSSTYPV
jgi:hypothetical protein